MYLSIDKQIKTMNEVNVLRVVFDGLCTGCGTCTGLCPKKAIKMILNTEKGIFLPEINGELCIDCGICYKVCPGEVVDFDNLNMETFGQLPEDPFIGTHSDCYTGYSLDDDIRFNSSSGGLITQFLIFVLEEGVVDGALVTRMSKEDPLMPEPFIARTRDEIIGASKSKYCPVPANIALQEILEAPDNEKFAVVGLPCHIQGIRKAESINKNLKNKIKLHLGIICNHSPSFHATEFMLETNDISKNEIDELNYRGEGWPGGMKIGSRIHEETFIPHFSVKYWGAIFNTFFFPSRCTVCTDKSCKLSDISFADAWIPELMKEDSKGTSLMVIRKNMEDQLNFKKLSSKMSLNPVSKRIPMESQQLVKIKRKVTANIKIRRLFKKKTPHYMEKEIGIEAGDYLSAVASSLKNYLSNSWFLVKLYLTIYQKAFNLKSRIFN